jgi:uncharacterized protein (TIGR02646 family)
MHSVRRGPAPPGLQAVRKKFTPAWVRYYRDTVGSKPKDDRWRTFQPHLSNAFFHICGYCEEICKGDVDHFQPKSHYPEGVYKWSNWVLACPFCNNSKGERWPSGGFVNPCESSATGRPEAHFVFDMLTGEILARPGLRPGDRLRAVNTRDVLKLNNYHHLKIRVEWLEVIRIALENSRTKSGRDELIAKVMRSDRELYSITRQYLEEHGHV